MRESATGASAGKGGLRAPGAKGSPLIRGARLPAARIDAARCERSEQRTDQQSADPKAPAARPVVKWVGGKTKLLPELLARVPERFGRYFEPFAGGAAMFFRLAPDRAVLGDANQDLIAMYRELGQHPNAVIDLLKLHEQWHGKKHYDEVRDVFNARSSTAAWNASALLYLNKTCFNGLWRVNASGEFNVPIGDYDEPNICDEHALRAAARLLARAELRSGSYEATVADAQAGDFAYLDPPYDDTFTSYTSDGFGHDEQAALATTARDLVAHGVHVMLSNSDTPLIRALYDGFTVERVSGSRSVSARGERRGSVEELLITAGPDRPIARRPHMTAMPKDQLFLDPTLKPPPDPADIDIPEVREKIYAALDLKYEHAQLGERVKAAFDAAMLSLAEHKLEQHPYIDRKSGKKRFFVADTTPKARTMAAPRRGGDDKEDEQTPDASLAEKLEAKAEKKATRKAEAEAAKVEKRTVSRASVESDLDPFAATRSAMSDLESTPSPGSPEEADTMAAANGDRMDDDDADPVVEKADGTKHSVPKRGGGKRGK